MVRYLFHPDKSSYLSDATSEQTNSLENLVRTCDAIIIASPTHTHLDYLQKLAKVYEGQVVIEKPIVSSSVECDVLLTTTPESFLKRVYVNHNFRFYPWVKETKKLLSAEPKGSLVSADFHLTHDFALKPAYKSSWRSQRATHGIGPAETLGVHLIDLIHYFFGPIAAISGHVRNLALTGESPDTSAMFLTTDNGTSCSVHASYAAPVAHYARIVALNLILTYQDGTLRLQKRPEPKAEIRSEVPAPQTLLESNPENLLNESLVQQLESIYRHADLTQPRDQEVSTAYQGIANVAVLGGFSHSLEQDAKFGFKDMPIYRHCSPHIF